MHDSNVNPMIMYKRQIKMCIKICENILRFAENYKKKKKY